MDHLPGLSEVPPAPRTPSQQARHLVFGYRGSQGILLVIGIILLLIGLAVSTFFCWGVPADIAILLSPNSTRGTILQAEVDRGVQMSGRRATKVRFEYEGDGRRYEGESSSYLVAPGQTGSIPIEYASMNPAWGRIAGESYATFGYLSLLTLILPIAGIIVLKRAIRSNRTEIRAFTHGQPIMARVTFRGQDHSTSINGKHPFLMRWEFKMENGAVHHGSISSMDLLDIKAFGEAEQVVVLYDPADPRSNTLFVP